MEDEDVSYYRHRATTESELAAEAVRADVAAIHLELAKQYQALVDRIDLREALRTASPVRLWA